ncbi:hypothetical protein AAG570_000780 [Ranatra chinensis]|uniref:PX domain-containing protein n=1 Tax=Ranatra chinensis TaxID=642074 RepID=A0ABD0YY38_9HEMI
MDISITESEKRATSSLNLRDYYTVYLIETRITDNSWELSEHGLGQLWRRYSEFEQLRYYLSSTYPWAVIPPLPEKKHTFPSHNVPTDTFDPDFVDRRRAGLENFLHRIATHPVISRDSMFLMFLQKEEGWRKSMKETGYIQLAEDKLKTLNAIGCINNALRVRAKIATKVYNIHKLHATYGKVFSEWSAIEKEMGDSLQRAGHFFDSIAAGIDSALEDEEQIIDQIKEYLYYASTLDDICNQRDILQFELEQLQDLLNSKKEERTRIQQGKSGVLSRLFGSMDSEEMRSAKLDQINDKIQEIERDISQTGDKLQDFKNKALSDIDTFQKTKVTDLTETLEDFMKLQIKMARKVKIYSNFCLWGFISRIMKIDLINRTEVNNMLWTITVMD